MWNNKYQNFLTFNFIAIMFSKNKENNFICFVPQIKFWKLWQFNILKTKVKWLRKLWIMLTTNKVVINLYLKTFIVNFVHFRFSAMFIKNYQTFWPLPCHFKNYPCFLPLLTENLFFFFMKLFVFIVQLFESSTKALLIIFLYLMSFFSAILRITVQILFLSALPSVSQHTHKVV